MNTQEKPILWGWRTILVFAGLMLFVTALSGLKLLTPTLAEIIKWLSTVFFGARMGVKASYHIGNNRGGDEKQIH